MYFGSVRFFRHLFLMVLATLLVVPTCFAVRFYADGKEISKQYEELKETTTQAQADAALTPSANEQQPPAVGTPQSAELGYTEKYPEMYVERTKYVPHDKCVFLTFDDGPSANTAQILDILKQKNVKATFFAVYQGSEEAKGLMQRIVREGHSLAVHSYSHDYRKIYASVDGFLDDFYLEWNYIYELTGVKSTVFRFPGGSINAYNSGIYQDIISEMLRRGFNYFDWNVSAEDATGAKVDAATIRQNIVSNAQNKNRAVVLMHDSASKKATVQALAPAIADLQAKGFSFAALTGEVEPVVYPYRDKIG